MRGTKHVSPRDSTEFHKLDAPWEWRYFNFNEPAACLFTFEYDVVVRMRGGSVEISGTPGAVAPWHIVVAVIHANGYDIAAVLTKNGGERSHGNDSKTGAIETAKTTATHS